LVYINNNINFEKNSQTHKSMLIDFTIGNYLSFKEKKTISFEATSITEYKENIAKRQNLKILKSAAIYGANASGKTNLIKGISQMRRLVIKSFEQSSSSEFDIIPFLLNINSINNPTFFEISFLIEKNKYRYGFEINKTSIVSEWLFEKSKSNESPLFVRVADEIEVMDTFSEGKGLEEKTRNNALFLSVVDQFNGEISKKIINWFSNLNSFSGLKHDNLRGFTVKMIDENSSNISEFLAKLDLGISEYKIKKEEFDPNKLKSDIPDEIVKQIITDLQGKMLVNIQSMHNVYNDEGNIIKQIEFDLRTQESAGTNKIFDISGPIFDTLNKGSILIIDELDAKLHPLMTIAITHLFNSETYNPNNAQLIFATHDTNLLTYGKFRRDQIYFIEKDKYDCSDIYSLIEYKEDNKKIRKDRSFEKDYIQGRYGAIPFIGNFTKLISSHGKKS